MISNYDHSAIRKAYPNVVTIIGNEPEDILDADGNVVSIDQTLVDAARVELDKLNYRIDRKTGIGTTAGYNSLGDQLDQLYRDINAGKFGSDAKTGEWFVGIASVKTNIPKPE